jgi:uncharacterized protein YqcC (DUF446 family)
MQGTDEIRTLVHRMEAEMDHIGLWSSQPPPPDAFASTQPFCFDTMSFENWLQWVFIPRIHALLDQGGNLPFRSQIAPLAEMMFAEMKDCPTGDLLNLIREFDRLAGDEA